MESNLNENFREEIKMKCQKCGLEFQERDLQESHDVPCYLFKGEDRKEKKNQADKFGRHRLCKKCHDLYEKMLPSIILMPFTEEQLNDLRTIAIRFSKNYFKKEVIQNASSS